MQTHRQPRDTPSMRIHPGVRLEIQRISQVHVTRRDCTELRKDIVARLGQRLRVKMEREVL